MIHLFYKLLYISSPYTTVCPGSSGPFYKASLLYKMGHYFLDILYVILLIIQN